MTTKKSPANSVIAKRRCMYGILIGAMFVIVANLSITALLLYYINISKQSIGDIRMESSRTTIGGNLLLEKSLYSKKVSSYNGSLQFLSGEAMKMASGKSAFILDSDVVMQAGSIKMTNSKGQEILYISPNRVKTNFRTVKLRGKAQALKSLQAKQIFSPTNMKIASPTKTLKMESAGDLNLRTAIGKLNIEALSTIHMEARNITLGSTDVFMPKLRGLDQTGNGLDQNGNGSSSNGTGHHQAVFEVCLCPNGAFFAANIEKGCVDSARALGSCNFT